MASRVALLTSGSQGHGSRGGDSDSEVLLQTDIAEGGGARAQPDKLEALWLASWWQHAEGPHPAVHGKPDTITTAGDWASTRQELL